MLSASRPRGFTLIELLTVIAIIAVLAAILFPLAGSVREQARAADCMSKLHQLYVSARVYRDDEGAYPPALFGYVETEVTDTNCTGQSGVPRRIPFSDGVGAGYVAVDQVANGFLYGEQVRDASVFRCPDNVPMSRTAITVAHYPNVQSTDPGQPFYWPTTWVGDYLASKGCPTDEAGTIDCFWDVDPNDPCLGQLHLKPRYFYVWDSYDLGPRVDASGTPIRTADDQYVFDRHYSVDWTGQLGLNDLPTQLKYANPPGDRTLLTYCTWHAAIAGANTVTAISTSGTARKVDIGRALRNGPEMYAR